MLSGLSISSSSGDEKAIRGLGNRTTNYLLQEIFVILKEEKERPKRERGEFYYNIPNLLLLFSSTSPDDTLAQGDSVEKWKNGGS